ncbi:acyl-CoA dehydrogenase [Sphingobium jiangsuense]|uniref:Acyl-CoA dehydrogenase n=1 Tax=Sphingobium jiangsuense TaxID=870476 RepID=A0A7W6BJ35_9SPHN|nr:acyl-CoA dehydrogenase family protein [Sphingobium jiangsuense]MBB3926869.1 acyl-CoA dehydrogenase [Sphingobium jiangsuense]GLS98877.1 acyl-CoA dehydrogenase [Sphingobium jiangsuense]
MDFNYSAEQRLWLDRLNAFMAEHVLPARAHFAQADPSAGFPWNAPECLRPLQEKARAAGLWNLFLPPAAQAHAANGFRFDSPGLSNLVYAPLAEVMGRHEFSSRIFNCSPPDTGNMELLLRYGSPDQQRRWLVPLMNGEMRSAFLMTEPAVASSDATNVETRIERDGDHYVINGRKWWSTGTGDADCRILIIMGKTDPAAPVHAQQSQILVPIETPGVRVVRMLDVFGYEDRPAGHGEVILENVRVPAENLILGEGRGFEIAQGRLGPGRIHHCMRTIGVAEEALELMCARLSERSTFGKPLAGRSIWQERIAWARTEIDMARLLTLRTAQLLDDNEAKSVRADISKIKLAVPRAALKVIDDAIQAFGGGGVCQDHGLARLYAKTRTMRLVDGPDEVHMRVIAKAELR